MIAVGWGVPSNAFERVQGTDADVGDRAAQLVDGPAEPVSDLSFPADMNLSPRGDRAEYHQQSGEALQDRRARVVGELGLSLLKLDAYLRAGDALQVRCAQRRVEPSRNDDDDYDHGGQENAHHQCFRPSDALVHNGRSPCTMRSVRVWPSGC